MGRPAKEALIKQKGLVIWFTGLSGAGKSTLAIELERKLYTEGLLTEVLDGDKIRNGMNNNLGFSTEDRIENIRRISEVGKLFCDCGVVAISAFISPTISVRQMARKIIGEVDFFEVYVSTSLAVCEERDPKGLYKKARAGIIKDFTGISAPYEAPKEANLVIDTSIYSVEESVKLIFDAVMPMLH